ncbi:hypothetical protein [Streptomyces sp. 4N124]|uniref:hypothetical protein n=1 Tax=Streptomyces sp. 4N124 TaxID=3457420 RepID=UPI003FD5C622
MRTDGAGKRSTVELLEGLAAPAGGRVRVLGHDDPIDCRHVGVRCPGNERLV